MVPTEAAPEAALALFDSLPPLRPEEMLGHWRGESFASGHPLDGLLETYHWHGKAFRAPDDVDPLLFRRTDGAVVPLRAVMPDPRWLERWPWLRRRAVGDGFQRWLLPLLVTRAPQARLRVVEHRGVATAAMLYDSLPIVDVFRRLDAATLLGLMDARGIPKPFFFRLRREPEAGDAQGLNRTPEP
ncbi:MAG: DUF4334 domain-containing protein [Cyanobium sp.]